MNVTTPPVPNPSRLGQPDPAIRSSIGVGTVELAHGATASWLAEGRLFLQHGPINLVAKVDGTQHPAPYADLIRAFPEWLGALVRELTRLRHAEDVALPLPSHPIALAMVRAVRNFPDQFVTPMAAVAGAVADRAIAELCSHEGVERAWANNGGDIALYLAPGSSLTVGVVPSLTKAIPEARITIQSDSPVRGIATSGWDGRSQSLGIADAVTVLARNAACADAAATLIANAVNVDHPAVIRASASTLDEHSDLGSRLVTEMVGTLDDTAITIALQRGVEFAKRLQRRGTIHSAALALKGQWRVVDDSTHPTWALHTASPTSGIITSEHRS